MAAFDYFMAGNKDSAFFNLERLVYRLKIKDSETLNNIFEFEGLRNDSLRSPSLQTRMSGTMCYF